MSRLDRSEARSQLLSAAAAYTSLTRRAPECGVPLTRRRQLVRMDGYGRLPTHSRCVAVDRPLAWARARVWRWAWRTHAGSTESVPVRVLPVVHGVVAISCREGRSGHSPSPVTRKPWRPLHNVCHCCPATAPISVCRLLARPAIVRGAPFYSERSGSAGCNDSPTLATVEHTLASSYYTAAR